METQPAYGGDSCLVVTPGILPDEPEIPSGVRAENVSPPGETESPLQQNLGSQCGLLHSGSTGEPVFPGTLLAIYSIRKSLRWGWGCNWSWEVLLGLPSPPTNPGTCALTLLLPAAPVLGCSRLFSDPGPEPCCPPHWGWGLDCSFASSLVPSQHQLLERHSSSRTAGS